MMCESNRFELYSKHDVFLHVVWAAVPKNYTLNMDSVCVEKKTLDYTLMLQLTAGCGANNCLRKHPKTSLASSWQQQKYGPVLGIYGLLPTLDCSTRWFVKEHTLIVHFP
jgi:hypothetical protein